MCSSDFICFYDWAECILIRRIDVNVKVSQNIFLMKISDLWCSLCIDFFLHF
jgi:hypothetical protein